mmetsp:Transcript_40603/g.46164  ORF Transcript_40603/g.46164 Transcript_40603/m.46164 type:complete len:947 (-) Transcript_40603:17-2857(-)
MRIGKLSKKERIGKKYAEPFPGNASRGMIVGEISTNVINSIYLPLWKDHAEKSMQLYIQDKIDYEEAVKEVEMNPSGNITIPEEPKLPPFHSQIMINDFTETLEETAKHFSTLNGWKVHANAARFERQLDEKYGILRPFITDHPEVEVFVRSIQRKWDMNYFSPFRKNEPPIAISTSIIIIFMMYRNNVSWKVLLLSSLFFLVGLQPWALVLSVAIVHRLLEQRRRKIIGKMDSDDIPIIEPYYKNTVSKEDKLFESIGQKLTDNLDVTKFDTMILGDGVSALYTAALLSRSGRKVLVLSPKEDASGCFTLKNCKDSKIEKLFCSVPFDVESSNISRISSQQELLYPALCTSTDYEGGVRFAQIGSEADGYAFEILSIPGMGASKSNGEIPFVLRTKDGLNGLMDDTACLLGDGWPGIDDDPGNSLSGIYVKACEVMNASANEYYTSRISLAGANKGLSKSTYGEACIHHASGFLDKSLPLNAHIRSLFAGIGMKGENIKPNKTSLAVHASNICNAFSGEGMYYPIGGPRSLCHALATVVEQCGGKIVTEVQCKELVFEEKTPADKASDSKAKLNAPSCLGIKLLNNRKILLSKNHSKRKEDKTFENIVITTSGFVDTFIRFMPSKLRQTYIPSGLPALRERRPHWKVLFALKGSAEDLDITGADFYRLPNASLAFDEVDKVTGEVNLGVVGGRDLEDVTEAAQDTMNVPTGESSTESTGEKPKKSFCKKYSTGESWVQISFPSAKDPSFENRHGKISTCVVTVEMNEDFVTQVDTKPSLFLYKAASKYSDAAQNLMERVKRDLIHLYPQLETRIAHSEMRGPFPRGLSHTPERYAAQGIRISTDFPNLFVSGADITIGDSFSGGIVSGWLTANTVMGYKLADLKFLGKNITSDLERFIESPSEKIEIEDVAVPYTQKTSDEFPQKNISEPELTDEGENSSQKKCL